MNNLKKEEILASSSKWIASLLNLLPGLGTGYIYQRRWVPYFFTIGATSLWFILGLILQGDSEPSQKDQLIGIAGLILISLVTAIESNIAQEKAVKILQEDSKKIEETKANKRWFK